MSGLALGSAGIYSTEHGEVLDGNAMRVAQILNDYDPTFHLEFIPERDRAGEAPYRVVTNSPRFGKSVVRYITAAEMQRPQDILVAIWKGDQRFHSADSILRDMELQDKAARLLQLKRQEEQALEAEEIVAFHLSGGREGKHYLKYNGIKIER